MEPVCCSMSSSNCCFLTCIEVSQGAGQVVWYSHLFQNFTQFIGIHTVKDIGIVNKAEIDVFFELSCLFNDPADVGNLISPSSALSKTSLNIWKFMVHLLLKPGLENFEHYLHSVWDECNCAVVWTSREAPSPVYNTTFLFVGTMLPSSSLKLVHFLYPYRQNSKKFLNTTESVVLTVLSYLMYPWSICGQWEPTLQG